MIGNGLPPLDARQTPPAGFIYLPHDSKVVGAGDLVAIAAICSISTNPEAPGRAVVYTAVTLTRTRLSLDEVAEKIAKARGVA